jgi:D-glycero-D-manno-heptose 1,7-bisphosphate phosphatase
MRRRRAVFLDRDGVVVIPQFREGRSFAPRRLEEFKIYPDANASIVRLKGAGFLVAIVTNQPDIGNGLIAASVIEAMHEILETNLAIDAIKTCPHRGSENCECRKPKPGMLLDLAREWDIDLTASYMVGDRSSDVEAGRAAGCRTVFVDLDYAEPGPTNADLTARSIGEAVNAILQFELEKESTHDTSFRA